LGFDPTSLFPFLKRLGRLDLVSVDLRVVLLSSEIRIDCPPRATIYLELQTEKRDEARELTIESFIPFLREPIVIRGEILLQDLGSDSSTPTVPANVSLEHLLL
jgi:hypothetical protein